MLSTRWAPTERHRLTGMRYLGISVHQKDCWWCLLDATGVKLERGFIPTSFRDLKRLAERFSADEALLVGQAVSGQMCFVRDAVEAAKVPILTFHTPHLQGVMSKRAWQNETSEYWIARAMQTNTTPPYQVYVPVGETRALRRLLAARRMATCDSEREKNRARDLLRSHGIKQKLDTVLANLDTHEPELVESLARLIRSWALSDEVCVGLDRRIDRLTRDVAVVTRLRTIPGVGMLESATIYATIGDISRFANSRSLSSYAGLEPTACSERTGSKPLREAMLRSAYTVVRAPRARAPEFMAFHERVRRRVRHDKVATVALARRMLGVAFHVWRDHTDYDSKRVAPMQH
jgi:transposase